MGKRQSCCTVFCFGAIRFLKKWKKNQNSQSEGPTANTSGVQSTKNGRLWMIHAHDSFLIYPGRFANAFFTLEFGFGQHKFLMYVWSTSNFIGLCGCSSHARKQQKSVLQTKKLCLDWSWLHLRTSCEQGGGEQCGCICQISNCPSPFQTARSSQNIMKFICSPTVNNTHVLQLWRDIS